MADQSVHIVLNPAAGGGVDEAHLRQWTDRRPRVELSRTTESGEGERLAREAVDTGANLVVAAGGDGTIREVVRGLLELDPDRRPQLGILPFGTANDLSRALGIGADLQQALSVLENGAIRQLDVIACELNGKSRYCVNLVNVGFGGRIHEALDEETKNFWGPLSYLRGGIETWSEMEPYEVFIRMDEDMGALSALNIVVANGSRAGWGFPVAPDANPFDGLLEVVVVRDASGLELSRLATDFLSGDPDPKDHEALVLREAHRVELRSDTPLPISLDGEPEEARECSFEILRGAVEILVPENDETP